MGQEGNALPPAPQSYLPAPIHIAVTTIGTSRSDASPAVPAILPSPSISAMDAASHRANIAARTYCKRTRP